MYKPEHKYINKTTTLGLLFSILWAPYIDLLFPTPTCLGKLPPDWGRERCHFKVEGGGVGFPALFSGWWSLDYCIHPDVDRILDQSLFWIKIATHQCFKYPKCCQMNCHPNIETEQRFGPNLHCGVGPRPKIPCDFLRDGIKAFNHKFNKISQQNERFSTLPWQVEQMWM